MRKILLLLLILFSMQISAQQQASGNLLYLIYGMIDDIPRGEGTDEYQKPTEEEFNIFKDVISNIVNKNYSSADLLAESIGYKLTKYLDTSGSTYFILARNSSNYWGTFIFNPSPLREKIIIQSPHAVYDSYTGKQGIQVFKETGSFALFLNGTHRCNSSSYSVCDGTTSACSNGGPATNYRASDQAHNIDNTFHAATEALEEEIDSLIYIQLHGFTKGSSDPYIIMSNGTSDYPAGIDYLSLLKDALLNIDPELTFKIPHIDTYWTRLIATTNTQGRLINGSGNPCSQSAAINNGRFIHLEQERSRLRDSDADRLKIASAINTVFPANTVTGVENLHEIVVENNLSLYPNPFNSMTNIIISLNETSHYELNLYDVLGRKLKTLFNGMAVKGNHTVSLNGNNLGSGIYFVALISNNGILTQKIIHLK